MVALIGKKVRMTQLFSDGGGALVPVTAIQLESNVVIQKKERVKDGYTSVLLGAVDFKKNVCKPLAGQFRRSSTSPKRFLREFRNFSHVCEVGDSVDINVFESVNYVDVTGASKGKGFQGVIKRHGFHGGRATHGSKTHREMGSTGMAAFPARVLKGTKMPGKMGNKKKTVQNLRIMKILPDRKVMLVKGAVPGPNGGVVYVRSACKKDYTL